MRPFDIVKDSLIRRAMKVHDTPLDQYSIRLARSVEEYTDAFGLVHFAYAYQGIESIHAQQLRITPQHVLPEAFVLVAYEGRRIVGTMTVMLDSPAGLPLDKDFPEQLAALRQEGKRLVEYGALAVVERCWHTGVTTLLNVAANNIASGVLDATHVVIGIHPKAAPFYRAVYDFHPFTGARGHAELHAPVVGLIQDLGQLEHFLRTRYRRAMKNGRFFVDHAFGTPPPCMELPQQGSIEEIKEWKMPRHVFQELFARRSDRLASLDGKTSGYLKTRRSRITLNLDRAGA